MAVISTTEPMILVEPPSVYAARLRMPQRLPPTPAATPTTPPKPTPPVRHRYDDFWTEVVFEILKTNGDCPLRITSVVNEAVKWGKFPIRAEREEHKKMMFRTVGKLIRTCRLDRYKRKFVTVPTSDSRRQAFLAKAAMTIEMPPPCV